MNGNPSAEQKRFHAELRELFYEYDGGVGELHHVFGSKANFKGFEKAGEWLVIVLRKDVHQDIKKYSFSSERGLFIQQQRRYEEYFNKPSPVPPKLAEFYNSMLNRYSITKGNPQIDNEQN